MLLEQPTFHSSFFATKFVEFTALLSIVVGMIVLFGWVYHIDTLKSIFPGWFPLKANAALCFILIGIALWLMMYSQNLSNHKYSKLYFYIARISLLLCGFIGLLTLCEYIFGWDLGIDQYLFLEPLGAVGTSHPGRMAQEAALDFLLLSIALWLTGNLRTPQVYTAFSVTLGILVTTLASAAQFSYLTPEFGPYGWFGFSIMAFHAAVMLTLLGTAVIVLNWQSNKIEWAFNWNSTIVIIVGLLTLVLIGFNTSRSQFSIKEMNLQIESSEKTLSEIKGFLIEIINIQSNVRAYLATDNEVFKDRYQQSVEISLKTLNHLKQKHNQSGQFSQVEPAVLKMLEWFPKVIAMRQTHFPDSELNKMVLKGSSLMDSLYTELVIAENNHFQQQTQLKMKMEQTSEHSYSLIFASTIFSLLLFISIIFKINILIIKYRNAEIELLSREKELRVAAAVFESEEGMLVSDANNIVLRINQGFTKITGYSADEVVGQTPHILYSGHHDKNFYSAMWTSINNTGAWEGEIWNSNKNGEIYPEYLTITVVKDIEGKVANYVATFKDITEKKQIEVEQMVLHEKIRQLAYFDSLTNLPNRRLFLDRFSQGLVTSKRTGKYGALMFLDLDNFKLLNDTHGHDAGDLLLIEVSNRLVGCTREMDTVSRLGGDEFVVLLTALDEDKSISTIQANTVAQKIRIILSEPYIFRISNDGLADKIIEHHCTASIGVVVFNGSDEGTQDDLMKFADAAMYEAKETGRNRVNFYSR